MNRQGKIFLFQRILPHYRIGIFNKLNKLSSIVSDQFLCIYGRSYKKSSFVGGKKESINFESMIVKNVWFCNGAAVWQNFLVPFKRYGRPKIVIMEHNPRILSLIPLMIYCKKNHIPFILWGHGGSRKRSVSEGRNLKDLIHKFLVKNCDAYICYTEGVKRELSKFADLKKLFVARNTLETDMLFAIRAELEKEGKLSVKRRLGLRKRYYICFIGRISSEKRIDYLVDVYALLKKECPDAGLLIIGDGPMRGALERYAFRRGPDDVVFLGAISDWYRSGEYLFASDVVVIPGRVGLPANHAFCFGLPVITQMSGDNGPFHSPEIEYIKEGETGFICENGNRQEMVKVIIDVFQRGHDFNAKVTDYCKSYLTIDNMVLGVKEAIDFVC